MRFFTKGLEALLSLMVVATVLVVATGVFFRYVINDPLLYTSELATLLYAYIIFLGLTMALKQDTLIGVDVIVVRLPEKVRKVCQFVVYVLMLSVSVFMTVNGLRLTMRTGSQLTALRISMKTLYAALPIGFSIFGVAVITEILAMMRPRKDDIE